MVSEVRRGALQVDDSSGSLRILTSAVNVNPDTVALDHGQPFKLDTDNSHAQANQLRTLISADIPMAAESSVAAYVIMTGISLAVGPVMFTLKFMLPLTVELFVALH